MNPSEKVAVLKKHGELYLFDDFLEVVLKLVVKGNKIEKYLKWKGRKEKKVDASNETACDIYIDSASRMVSKEFYEKF